MPPEIKRLTDQFLHNPVRIEVSRPATTASNITQDVVEIPANDWAKREALRRLIREAEPTLNNAIVFCNRKRDVDVVAKSLTKHGFDAAPIHGDLDQSLRTKTLDSFRTGELKILVASRRRGARARHSGRQPCLQFRRADPCRRLCPPHRPHRPRRAQRRTPIMLASPRDGKYVEAIEKLTGQKLARREMMDIEVREESRPRRDDRGAQAAAATAIAAVTASTATAVRRTASFTTMSPAWSRRKPRPTVGPLPPRHPGQAPQEPRKHRGPTKPEHRAPSTMTNGIRKSAAANASTMSRRPSPEAVDKSELPAFLFRPVPVKKPVPQAD